MSTELISAEALASADYIALIDARNLLIGRMEAIQRNDLVEITEAFMVQLLAEGDLAGTPVAVEFDVDQWENGYFYASSEVEVMLADGGSTSLQDCEETFEETLTALSDLLGPLTRKSGLVVDLMTRKVEVK